MLCFVTQSRCQNFEKNGHADKSHVNGTSTNFSTRSALTTDGIVLNF